MPERYTIGTLARQVGLNVETIRYYQRRGLVQEPARLPGKIRHYGEEHGRRLRFIREAQKLGFSLDEVGELLSLEDGLHCREVEEIAGHKLAAVRERIARAAILSLVSLLSRTADTAGRGDFARDSCSHVPAPRQEASRHHECSSPESLGGTGSGGHVARRISNLAPSPKATTFPAAAIGRGRPGRGRRNAHLRSAPAPSSHAVGVGTQPGSLSRPGQCYRRYHALFHRIPAFGQRKP